VRALVKEGKAALEESKAARTVLHEGQEAARIAEATRIAARALELERVAAEAARLEKIAAEAATAKKIAQTAARVEGTAAHIAEAERLAAKAAEAERLAAKAVAAEKKALQFAEFERGVSKAAEAERLVAQGANAEKKALQFAEAERLAARAGQAAEAERIAARAAQAVEEERIAARAARAVEEERLAASAVGRAERAGITAGTPLTRPRQAGVNLAERRGALGFATKPTRPPGPLNRVRAAAAETVAAEAAQVRKYTEAEISAMKIKELVGEGKAVSQETYNRLVSDYFEKRKLADLDPLKTSNPVRWEAKWEKAAKEGLGPIKDRNIIIKLITDGLKEEGKLVQAGEEVVPRLLGRNVPKLVVPGAHFAEEAAEEAGNLAAGLRRGAPAAINAAEAVALKATQEAVAAKAIEVTGETAQAVKTAVEGVQGPLKKAAKVAEQLGASAKNAEGAARVLEGEARAAQEAAAFSRGSTAVAAAAQLEKEAQTAARVTTPAEAAEMGRVLGGVPASDAKAAGDASVGLYERIFGKTSIIMVTPEGVTAAAKLLGKNVIVIPRKQTAMSLFEYIKGFTPYGRAMSTLTESFKLGASNIARFEVVARNIVSGANAVGALPKYNIFAERSIKTILEHATYGQVSKLCSVFTPERTVAFKTALVRVFQTNPVDAALVLDTMLLHVIPNSKYNIEVIDALINTMKTNPGKAVDELLKINGLITADAIKTVGASAAAYHKGMGWFKSKAYFSLLAAGLGSSVLFLANYNNIPDMKTFAEKVYWGKEKAAEELEENPNYSSIKKRAADLRKAATLAVVRQFDPDYAAELERQQAAANEAAAAAKAAREEAKKTWFGYLRKQIGIDDSVNGRKRQENLEKMGKKAIPILVAAGVGVAATAVGIPPPLAAALGSAAAAAASPTNQKQPQVPRLRL
jgi:hypothetical protein